MKSDRTERFMCTVFWMLLTIIGLLLILCFAGCVSVDIRKVEFGSDGKVIAEITARYNRCMVSQKLEGVVIDYKEGKASILKQESDAEGVARGVAEGLAKGLKP